MEARQLTTDELKAGLEEIRQSRRDGGVLRLIVRRPTKGEREVLEEGRLDLVVGLVGDNWLARSEQATPKRTPNPETQLTLMNARAAQLIAGSRERWPLAGDQLYVDLDLSPSNLPPGTRLAIGSALVEVTAEPHNGCKQFVGHFGMDAMLFVNSPEGKALSLRGINTRVVQAGVIRVGDVATKR
ncbi:MAG: MOSC domain-containing protein [Candidatus Handelsmanbacteria bacterium]|nr:MOSC domain-containing protein [Candidatus Handelsmanbacteria bacterium]